WKLSKTEYLAVYHFLFGTGKWEDVSGSIEALVWAEPEEHGQVMPPTVPSDSGDIWKGKATSCSPSSAVDRLAARVEARAGEPRLADVPGDVANGLSW
ncbi:MAG: hypothetical protein ACXVUE_10670, partial [Solirubrobacteraceae bacterium]